MIHPQYNPDWSEDVKALYTHDMQQYWDKSLSVNNWNQYKSLLDHYISIANQQTKSKILDVGCAQGTLALLLAEQQHFVTALDLRQESLDYAASRYESGDINFVQGNVLEMQLDDTFDLIYANQIIEHLVYPTRMVTRLKQLLNKNGRLVVTTPNWQYLTNRLPCFSELGNPEQLTHKQFTADGDGHFFAYKKNELIEIFRESGFAKIDTFVYETPIISGHLKFRYLHRFIPYQMLSLLDRALLRVPLLRDSISHQLMVIASI